MIDQNSRHTQLFCDFLQTCKISARIVQPDLGQVNTAFFGKHLQCPQQRSKITEFIKDSRIAEGKHSRFHCIPGLFLRDRLITVIQCHIGCIHTKTVHQFPPESLGNRGHAIRIFDGSILNPFQVAILPFCIKRPSGQWISEILHQLAAEKLCGILTCRNIFLLAKGRKNNIKLRIPHGIQCSLLLFNFSCNDFLPLLEPDRTHERTVQCRNRLPERFRQECNPAFSFHNGDFLQFSPRIPFRRAVRSQIGDYPHRYIHIKEIGCAVEKLSRTKDRHLVAPFCQIFGKHIRPNSRNSGIRRIICCDNQNIHAISLHVISGNAAVQRKNAPVWTHHASQKPGKARRSSGIFPWKHDEGYHGSPAESPSVLRHLFC